MNLELFSNEVEREMFLNYKANIRIKSLEKIIEKDKEEINNNINKCGEIFSTYNETNIIKEILNIDEEINNILNEEYDEEKITQLNQKRDALSFDLKTFLENLMKNYQNENNDFTKKSKYLSDKEDIEFSYKKIVSRTMDMQDRLALIRMIEKEYPSARTFDVENYKQTSTIFNFIRENTIPQDKTPVFENTGLYVIKISEAPTYLLDNEIMIEETTSLEQEPAPEMQTDTSFFGIDDSLTEAILNNEEIKFEEAPEVKVDSIPEVNLDVVIEPLEQKEEIKEEEPAPIIEEIKIEDQPIIEPTIIEEAPEPVQEEQPIVQPEENTNEEQLTYTIDDKDTLYSIAYALFQDEKLADIAVQKILEENKEIIGQRLTEKNIVDLSNIDKEHNLFTGLTINLTNVFEQVVVENNKNQVL